jgi:pimeloyl-ACP methyl ester carboxylesterase
MTALLEPETPAAAQRRRRPRIARLERPLLAAGLALIALHLLDRAFSGSHTMLLGVLAIVAAPLIWLAAQPRVTRPTRVVLGVVVGLLSIGFGVASHALHAVNSGLDRYDVTGIGMIAGGLLLVAAGLTALAAPRRAPRRRAIAWRAAHGAGWLAGAFVLLVVVIMPFAMGLKVTHAPRWEIQESSLGIGHEEVRIDASGDRTLSAWYVPSRNGAAVLVGHGSGGSRERVLEEIRLLAGHGYGVLAFDLFGNGESSGHSNGLGDNAQPAVDAALAYVAGRPDVDPERIAAFGSSLGGEVLLEAAARDPRIRAVISDGAARPEDKIEVTNPAGLERALAWVQLQAPRIIGGERAAPSLIDLMPRIAPRPVLLISAGGDPDETPVNRAYLAAAGPSAELYSIPEAGHTSGLAARPQEYEARVTAFLERALAG